VAVTLTLKIFFASYLHIGTHSDSRTFEETWDLRKMRPYEWLLGDKIYNGCGVVRSIDASRRRRCLRVVAGHTKARGGQLTAAQQRENAVVDFVRARVEHVITEITGRALFKERPGYRGGPVPFFRSPLHALGRHENLTAFVAITLHATAALTAEVEPGRQLLGYGPWSHRASKRAAPRNVKAHEHTVASRLLSSFLLL